MGEKVTPPATSKEVLRANALRDARKRGTRPALTQISSSALSDDDASSHSLDIEKDC